MLVSSPFDEREGILEDDRQDDNCRASEMKDHQDDWLTGLIARLRQPAGQAFSVQFQFPGDLISMYMHRDVLIRYLRLTLLLGRR